MPGCDLVLPRFHLKDSVSSHVCYKDGYIFLNRNFPSCIGEDAFERVGDRNKTPHSLPDVTSSDTRYTCEDFPESCQRCHELLARTTVREAAQALLRRRCIRPGPFHQVQGHRLGRRLVSTTAEDIEAVSLEAKILRARSRPRLQPTCRISALKNPVRSRAGVPRCVPCGGLASIRRLVDGGRR